MTAKPQKLKKSRDKIPHTYAILFLIMIAAMVASYLIPAGQYEREEVDGRTVVIDNSFAEVEQSPVGFFELFKAIPTGMSEASSIIFYIFLVGGAFGIIRATGAIESGIAKVVDKLEKREKFLIPIIMILFSVLGATIGMAEEVIIFVPIGIAVARAIGFDAMTGTAMVSLGAASGFIGGMLNPFTVGIAQGIAELQIFSGIGFRFGAYIFFLGFAIWYVMRYAAKVKKDPTQSVIYEIEKRAQKSSTKDQAEALGAFNWRHGMVFVFLAVGLGINVYGVFEWGWYLTELAASFVIIGFAAGLVGNLGVNRMFDAFVDGMKLVVFGALIVGFARAILVIMEQGVIMDTMIHGLSSVISGLPNALTVIGMFFTQVVINFFIPSGSGQAATTMPIMTPLSDLLSIERQVAVLAYQYGDGITNSIIPTSAALMGYLAVAGIPYEKWVKFVWKLVVGWLVIALVALVIAVMIGVS
ncbi:MULTISPECIES: YfcC family protein [unclassified Planococcus (in: firmicutes)]|uniref:YfcC family protein n=1 Tax=unclassified Planococcus (in: firmicutes) TaxID=2662419 RepID=UPI000C32A046|nr:MULTISPECIES: AbgT family transporter [unclassified Planococcus (in: firmicutes)]AUD14666.1 C4-dicarboxylate ABC transporter permease [Planococcus sp. MB-3u-03]PKG44970.1 C4-dicarboxylate ABC transporter permease [Planococcus sp. Urea-trap-24]PKG87313.1 C4-dicarboxylate ABC transporter permease [Planococcus sp. Urea-3u-39]PKH42438.1 C4-dicarboxylate ABC transporter permease [Planococcus sp. MB-3u-09]